jgi:hypothetical protein
VHSAVLSRKNTISTSIIQASLSTGSSGLVKHLLYRCPFGDAIAVFCHVTQTMHLADDPSSGYNKPTAFWGAPLASWPLGSDTSVCSRVVACFVSAHGAAPSTLTSPTFCPLCLLYPHLSCGDHRSYAIRSICASRAQ